MNSDEQIIDLHTHSTASDGAYTPGQIVQMAKSIGIGLLALTDHDTIDGISEAARMAEFSGIDFIPGFELSVKTDKGAVHLLGLGVYNPSAELETLLERIRKGRRERNPRIIRNLNELGYNITLSEVRELAGGEVIGRPHIAQALIRHGYVADYNEAFKRFLNSNGAAYSHRWRPDIAYACEVISNSGGIPILAHPGLIGFSGFDEMEAFITRLKASGLRGVEVHYSHHSREQHTQLLRIAKKLDLIISGGSDFHGANHPEARLGRGTDGEFISIEYARALLDQLHVAQLRY